MARLEAGTYEVEVTDAYTTQSSKGTLGIFFALRSDSGHTTDKTVWVTPGSYDRAIQDLETLGFGQDQIDSVESLDKIKEVTKGNRVSVVIEDETYNGNTSPKVKYVNAVGAKKATGVQTKAALFALLKGQPAPMVSAPRTQAVRPSQPPPVAWDPNEDAPF